MPAPDSKTPAACPPHHWFIQAQHGPQGTTENWTCGICSLVRVVDRQRLKTSPVTTANMCLKAIVARCRHTV